LTSKDSSPKLLLLEPVDSKAAVAASAVVSAVATEVVVVSVAATEVDAAASVAAIEADVADSEGKLNFKDKAMMNCFNE
jgi:hypothetical protein